MTPADSQLLNGGFIDLVSLHTAGLTSMDKTCLSGEGQRDSVSSPFLDPFELYRTSSRSLSLISTQQRDQPRRWAFVTDQEGLDHIQTRGERQRTCSCPESDNTRGFWQHCLNYLIGDWDCAWARGRGQWRPWKVIFESLGVQLYQTLWVSGSILLWADLWA